MLNATGGLMAWGTTGNIGRLFSFEICAKFSCGSSERFSMLFMENGLSKTDCACGSSSRPKDAIVQRVPCECLGRCTGVKNSTFSRQMDSTLNRLETQCLYIVVQLVLSVTLLHFEMLISMSVSISLPSNKLSYVFIFCTASTETFKHWSILSTLSALNTWKLWSSKL